LAYAVSKQAWEARRVSEEPNVTRRVSEEPNVTRRVSKAPVTPGGLATGSLAYASGFVL
jgi:hypothetical protein